MRRRRPQAAQTPAEGHLARLTALRPPGCWNVAERQQLAELAARMAELDQVNAALAEQGFVTSGRWGPRSNPLIDARRKIETSIRMMRSALRMATTVGEARRFGRRLAEQPDDSGLLPDGSLSMTLIFALDPLQLLARPEGYDEAAAAELHHRLLKRGEINADGEVLPGGVLARAAAARPETHLDEPETSEPADPAWG